MDFYRLNYTQSTWISIKPIQAERGCTSRIELVKKMEVTPFFHLKSQLFLIDQHLSALTASLLYRNVIVCIYPRGLAGPMRFRTLHRVFPSHLIYPLRFLLYLKDSY
jgi:hypothetical protein